MILLDVKSLINQLSIWTVLIYHLVHLVVLNCCQGYPHLLTICVGGWYQNAQKEAISPAWTLPQNLFLLTSPVRLPRMARAMEQMTNTVRLTTPVDQPSGLLLDTVTWDNFAKGSKFWPHRDRNDAVKMGDAVTALGVDYDGEVVWRPDPNVNTMRLRACTTVKRSQTP